MPRKLTTITPESASTLGKLTELWSYRELAVSMMVRDIKVRYKQTVLGVAWAVLQPLLTMMIFTIIFGRLANIPSDGYPYPVFVYAGLLAWNLFASSISAGGVSMVSAANIVNKVYFSRLIIPLSSMGVALVDFAISFLVLLLLMAFFGVGITAQMILFPIFLLGLLLAALGVSLWLAAVTVLYRDFRFVIPFMVQIWMYITPVIYPASFLPSEFRWLIYVNPVFGWVSAIKSSILGNNIDWLAVMVSLVLTLVVLIVGLKYFTKMEQRFADII